MVMQSGPTKKREELRRELNATGFAWDYIDNWQPKTDYWAHKDMLSNTGKVQKEVGTKFPNMPGHPDHAMRMSRRGLLPFPPSTDCECKSCRERNGTVRTDRKFMSPQDVARQANTAYMPPPEDAPIGGFTVPDGATPGQVSALMAEWKKKQADAQVAKTRASWQKRQQGLAEKKQATVKGFTVPDDATPEEAMKAFESWQARYGATVPETPEAVEESVAVDQSLPGEDSRTNCPECDWKPKADSKRPEAALRTHLMHHRLREKKEREKAETAA